MTTNLAGPKPYLVVVGMTAPTQLRPGRVVFELQVRLGSDCVRLLLQLDPVWGR